MPNHVVNELIFEVPPEKQEEILKVCLNKDDKIDFEVLVPLPINIWWGSVGSNHERAFKQTALDWCTHNWGTKWNAYSALPIDRTDSKLTLTFQTAWNPPYNWIVAIFNSLKISFIHNWMSEGSSKAFRGEFDQVRMEEMGAGGWHEKEITDEPERRRIHKLLWGVEEFEGEEDES